MVVVVGCVYIVVAPMFAGVAVVVAVGGSLAGCCGVTHSFADCDSAGVNDGAVSQSLSW